MRLMLTYLGLLLACGTASGQMFNPVKWSFETKQENEQIYTVYYNATIDPGWAIYSQFVEEGGPYPTEFVLNDSAMFGDIGPVIEPSAKAKYDPIFEMDVIKFYNSTSFHQTVITQDQSIPLTGYLVFIACDDERCLSPVTVDFRFDFEAQTGDLHEDNDKETIDSIDQRVQSIIASYKYPIGDCPQEEGLRDKSLLWTFVLGFSGGLLALLTPCVFPMIPLTVSFFSKDSKRKGWVHGAIYGASIIVIYVLLGFLITMVFGAEALNELSTNWIANTAFFLIFIAFAFSFFGYYELQLPSSWANKSDMMADKGGLIGIFFMAFTLALVSFSCTGPIIGSAIVQSASSAVGPFIVMLGFSTALALPFGLFAAFPAWLNKLPQSGSWMNSVKVMLGFLELALAFKFLSVADMTSHWGFLKYELFVGIWVLIAACMALYLFGLIKFPHDSKLKKLSMARMTLAVGMSVLSIYLATGFVYSDRTQTYNALPLLSGLAPPAHYNFFMPAPEPDIEVKTRYASFTKCANNLDCFKDYKEGVAYAKEVNKPILLDFTGYGCVNCRKTEEHIWVEDGIWSLLTGEFVLISLYVDDRMKIPTQVSKSRGQKLMNVGNLWADFQIVNFEQNTQPLYVVLSLDERVLSGPRGYNESVDAYYDFLQCGLRAFQQ